MAFGRQRLIHLAILAASCVGLAFGMVGCGTSDSGTSPATVTISVTPASLSLAVGETATITATVSGGTGAVSFTSSATAVATVSSSGLVTAMAAGTATITASVAGQSGVQATTQVTVTDPPAAEFAIAFGEITAGRSARRSRQRLWYDRRGSGRHGARRLRGHRADSDRGPGGWKCRYPGRWKWRQRRPGRRLVPVGSGRERCPVKRKRRGKNVHPGRRCAVRSALRRRRAQHRSRPIW